MNLEFCIGVDVGTESVRVGLFDASDGKLLSIAKRPIQTWHGDGAVVEQSTDQIWHCLVAAIREVMAKRQQTISSNACHVIGIGFCATCSLAVIDAQGTPLTVGRANGHFASDQDDQNDNWVRNVIVWMDQRATSQAERINSTGHPLLRFTGGQISPEMQLAKLLWLKENVPNTFDRAADFFDLADFCTWRATESTERSQCTMTCKWTFLGHEQRWDESFFRTIGLDEIVDQKFQKIGQKVLPIGAKIGSGLSPKAAREFGLPEGTPVGVGLIDAHAGALGTLSGSRHQMALILGTSLCTMNLVHEPKFVDGIWGPYFGVVFPRLWLNEGGLTSFGSALIYALKLHPFYHIMKSSISCDFEMLKHLEQIAIKRAGSLEACSTFFGQQLHIVPEFLGNRSPDADPMATGIVAGFRMDSSIWDNECGLVEWMISVLCALCYGLKEIVDQIELQTGNAFTELILTGGMVRNCSLLRLIADITQKNVFVPYCEQSVLLGSALAGSVASNKFNSIEEASAQMVNAQWHLATKIEPQRTQNVLAFHQKKFMAYKALKKCGKSIRELI